MLSMSWYTKMYGWFKRLPIFAFALGPIAGLAFGILDHIELWLFDPEWLALLIWPIAGIIVGFISYLVVSIFLSPVVLRTSAAIGELDREDWDGKGTAGVMVQEERVDTTSPDALIGAHCDTCKGEFRIKASMAWGHVVCPHCKQTIIAIPEE